VGSAYGAAGSLIVVIVWVYYSAMIFYFGAEFTHVRARGELPVDPHRRDGPTLSSGRSQHVGQCLQPICATDPAWAAYQRAIIEPGREPWLIVSPVARLAWR